jgi:hypothetical protein
LAHQTPVFFSGDPLSEMEDAGNSSDDGVTVGPSDPSSIDPGGPESELKCNLGRDFAATEMKLEETFP